MIEPDCFRPAPAGRRSAALLGLALCVVLAACDKAAPKSESTAAAPAASATGGAAIAIKTPIQKDTGFAWIVTTDVNPATRKLSVYENGKLLGPGDSIHDDIRKKGLGAFSHWDPKTPGVFTVYFSTSDNSDPNSNGRDYELK
jgi:hypothetical protein